MLPYDTFPLTIRINNNPDDIPAVHLEFGSGSPLHTVYIALVQTVSEMDQVYVVPTGTDEDDWFAGYHLFLRQYEEAMVKGTPCIIYEVLDYKPSTPEE